MKNSHATAPEKNTRATKYVTPNGLSLEKNTNEDITVKTFLHVVIATAGTAPKCFTSVV